MSSQSYVDFTKNISYKRERKLYRDPNTENTEKSIKSLKVLLSTVPQMKQLFDESEDAASFFEAFDVFAKTKTADEEAFYQMKVGYHLNGVPTKVIYILNKAIKENGTEYPNLTLQSVYKLLKKYDDFCFKNNDAEITLVDIIYFVFKDKFDLITPRRNRVGIETYIADSDRIALIPDDITECISEEITYDKDRGLITNINGKSVEIRTLPNKIGITTDDFDLRKAF